MPTLDRWRSFLEAPKTIELVHAELIGGDTDAPLMSGPAKVRMSSLQDFSYSMTPSDGEPIALFKAIEQQRVNSYDPLARLRLIGKEADGTDWSCGWTMPQKVNMGGNWEIDGKLTALDVTDQLDIETHSTELLFRTDLLHPMARILGTLAGPGQARFERRCEVLGSAIVFTYERQAGVTSITASHSAQLPATFAERWLIQPLRIMLGQPIYPRLIARNMGYSAVVWILRAASLDVGSWSAFMVDEFSSPDRFFDCYCELLRMIALDEGERLSEVHPVTRYYDEIAQATAASRWAIALTLAGCTEGLESLLRKKMAPTDAPDEPISAAATNLIKQIEGLDAPDALKRKAIDALTPPKGPSTTRTLRALRDCGVISPNQFSTWQRLRNRLMHGEFISLFSNEDEDRQLMHLVAIVRALTSELIKRS